MEDRKVQRWFQCPEGLVPLSNPGQRDRVLGPRYVFQCPEGLVPLSNSECSYFGGCTRWIGFNAPKGWYLFLTFEMPSDGQINMSAVSMPRRAGTSF